MLTTTSPFSSHGYFLIFVSPSLCTFFVSLQNVVPVLDGPVEGGASASSQHQLLEQEKRIEITCALAAEASRRSRLLSGELQNQFIFV